MGGLFCCAVSFVIGVRRMLGGLLHAFANTCLWQGHFEAKRQLHYIRRCAANIMRLANTNNARPTVISVKIIQYIGDCFTRIAQAGMQTDEDNRKGGNEKYRGKYKQISYPYICPLLIHIFIHSKIAIR
jgi:hypothetical protein